MNIQNLSIDIQNHILDLILKSYEITRQNENYLSPFYSIIGWDSERINLFLEIALERHSIATLYIETWIYQRDWDDNLYRIQECPRMMAVVDRTLPESIKNRCVKLYVHDTEPDI